MEIVAVMLAVVGGRRRSAWMRSLRRALKSFANRNCTPRLPCSECWRIDCTPNQASGNEFGGLVENTGVSEGLSCCARVVATVVVSMTPWTTRTRPPAKKNY